MKYYGTFKRGNEISHSMVWAGSRKGAEKKLRQVASNMNIKNSMWKKKIKYLHIDRVGR